jgi:hypothetical protein
LPQITAQSPYWETLLILDKIREQMGKELDLEVLEEDWKFLQQYRIDEDFTFENEWDRL